MPTSPTPAVPRLTYLRIKNYRALRDVEFRDLTPLTVLIGPNGSGKSTVLDALDFLAEAVRGNLVGAWEKRGKFQGLRTHQNEGSISFEIKVSNVLENKLVNYSFEINEGENENELLFLNEELVVVSESKKKIIFESKRDKKEHYIKIKLEEGESPSTLQIKTHPIKNNGGIRNLAIQWAGGLLLEEGDAVFEFVNTITSYRLFHLTDDHLKGYSDAGPREELSPNGDNLPNVLYYLHERHPETLARITAQLRRWVPGLADVVPEITSDERLLLRFKDGPFEKPLPAQYMSGGTMRLAALLTLLYEPGAAGLLGIEEPENELHPQLLPQLAEELIAASEDRQLLVATHSPALLNGLEPAQVWILHRGADGYTQATRAADLPGIPAMVAEGSPLGYLWSRNFFDVGSPLASPLTTK